MTPIMQTRFGERGNCLAACVATVLGVPLERVDFSCADYPAGRWRDKLADLLRPLGFAHYYGEGGETFCGAVHIAHGPRRCRDGRDKITMTHACVYRDGELIHDPHPDSHGLERVSSLSLLLPLEPARLALPLEAVAGEVVSQVRKLEQWIDNRKYLRLDVRELERASRFLREYARALGYDWNREGSRHG